MKNSLKRVVVAGASALLLMGLSACSPGTASPESGESTSSQKKSADLELLSDSELNFKISLPGKPRVQSLDDETGEAIIRGSLFVAEVSNDEAYFVGVSRSEMIDKTVTWDDRLALERAAEGMVTGVNGTVVSTENTSELLGYPASTTTFTAPNPDGKPYKGRSQMVMRDQTLYNIMAIGGNESDFDAIVASFSFLD